MEFFQNILEEDRGEYKNIRTLDEELSMFNDIQTWRKEVIQ